MEPVPDSIFISYSRADGRDFAEAFERRLEEEGIRSWRDLKSMEAGDIRPQVLRAIEHAKHFVLILSRRALASDWIKREWSHARLMGKRSARCWPTRLSIRAICRRGFAARSSTISRRMSAGRNWFASLRGRVRFGVRL